MKIYHLTHFTIEEFVCPCCGVICMNADVIQGLEEIRKILNRPITVTSGYRCYFHNLEIGGVKGSRHCYGQAADIVVPGLSIDSILQAALQVECFKYGGIGVYNNHLHVDIREVPARWDKSNHLDQNSIHSQI